MDCRTALLMVLEQVDYINGACSFTEMVGAVLPKEVIVMARKAIADEVALESEPKCYCPADGVYPGCPVHGNHRRLTQGEKRDKLRFGR